MTPLRLTDTQLRELMQAAQMVPPDLHDVFLERVAAELRGKDLGDGLVPALPMPSRVRWRGTPGGRRRSVRMGRIAGCFRTEGSNAALPPSRGGMSTQRWDVSPPGRRMNAAFMLLGLNRHATPRAPSPTISTGGRNLLVALRTAACRQQRGLCYWCGEPMFTDVESTPPKFCPADHLVPRYAGGKTVAGNIVAACQACNNVRNAFETNRRRACEGSLVASTGDDAPRSPFEGLKSDLYG